MICGNSFFLADTVKKMMTAQLVTVFSLGKTVRFFYVPIIFSMRYF